MDVEKALPEQPQRPKHRISSHAEPEISVVRLPPDAAVEPWMIEAVNANVVDKHADSVVISGCLRTREELSIVVPTVRVPEPLRRSTTHEGGWACLRVEDEGIPLDFALVGILSSIIGPLAAASVSVFALSTYNTDYVLVKADQLSKATSALIEAGFEII